MSAAHKFRQSIAVIANADVDSVAHPLTRIDAIAEALPYSNSRAHDLIYRTEGTADFTEQDWLDCALACIDQAGFPIRDQAAIETILRASFDRRQANGQVIS